MDEFESLVASLGGSPGLDECIRSHPIEDVIEALLRHALDLAKGDPWKAAVVIGTSVDMRAYEMWGYKPEKWPHRDRG